MPHQQAHPQPLLQVIIAVQLLVEPKMFVFHGGIRATFETCNTDYWVLYLHSMNELCRVCAAPK